jgi:transmembrane sensor
VRKESFSESEEGEATDLDVAVYWLMRTRSADFSPADQAEFAAWLAHDPDHSRLYQSVQATWNMTGAAASAPEILLRRQEARMRVPPVRASWKWRLTISAAASVLLAVAGVLGWRIHISGPGVRATQPVVAAVRTYETELGGRSIVPLEDGSTITLNTSTRVVVDFSGVERSVVLERGQALFEVAADASRPFVVEAAGRRITALGTAFDVRVEDERVQVTLLHGRVAVAATPAEARKQAREHPGERRVEAATILAPDEQLIAEADAAPVVRATDVERVTSWREGRLVFDDETLPDAVAEINRYTPQKVELADPRLQSLRVSGVFSAGEPSRFVEALTVALPVAVAWSDAPTASRRIQLVWRERQP